MTSQQNRALRFARCFLVSLTAIVFLASPLLGQANTSSLSGTVTDSSGAVIPGAVVLLRDEGTKMEHTVSTTNTGSYTFPNLAPATYTVKVDAKGFQSQVQQGTQIDPSIGRKLDFSLTVGSEASTVTVQADANVLQTESASVGQLVSSEQVKSIQLNGRSPIYLSQLEPGVSRNAPLSSFNFAIDYSGPVVNGARGNESLLTLDGAPMVRTRANGTQIGVADVDTISQVQILTTSYPAQYGETSGGLIQLVPRSGTSDFHGSAYEYLRNSFLNANTWTRNQSNQPALRDHPSPFRFNQFGWSLNGPVIVPHLFNSSRQKLFFLAAQEYLRYRQNTTQTGKVPTALMRQGNFSELLTSNIFYQGTVQLKDPTTGAVYLNNQIPQGELSQNGLALLNAYPAPNAANSGYNWQASAAAPQNQRKDTLIIDYAPADAHHLRFSLLNYNLTRIIPFASNFNLLPQVSDLPDQIGVLRYTWTINPRLVNNLSFSASADHSTVTIDLSSGLYDRTRVGLNYPYLFSASDKLIPNKLPTINLANFTTLTGLPYPSHSGGVILNLADNLTKVIGTHTVTVGGLWQRSSENNFDQISVDSNTPGATNNQNGQFVFTDTHIGHPTSKAAVGNAALGLFDTYGEIGQKSYTVFQANMYEFFAQDQWRATPKLVMEYGGRYSIMQPYSALWGNQSVFSTSSYDPSLAPTVNPATGSISGGDRYNGIVIPGSGFPDSARGHVPANIIDGTYSRLFRGFNSGYSKTIWSDFQPRLGVTYQVTPTTVVRAGGGRFVQRIGIADTVQLGGNAPFQPSATVTAGLVDNPGGVQRNSFPLALSSQAYNFPNPNSWSWNAAVEQEFPNVATLTLGYVGRRGLHLTQLENINQLLPGTVQANPAGEAPDALRPYRGYSTILQDTNAGSSTYHGLQLNARRRLTKGLLFGVAYTWSKSLDFGSTPGFLLPNYYNPSINYAPSDFDIRNVFVASYVWNIPYGLHSDARVVRTALANWQLSGVTQVQSGVPFNVRTGDDFAGVGPGSGAQRWTKSSTPKVLKQFSGNGVIGHWFDPTVFSRPLAGTFAPRGTRNAVYGPGFQSWNIALLKNFQILPNHDNHVVTFKAEAFNFTNHPNYDTPDTNPTSGTFGQVTQKGNTYPSERQMQFSLRYQF